MLLWEFLNRRLSVGLSHQLWAYNPYCLNFLFIWIYESALSI